MRTLTAAIVAALAWLDGAQQLGRWVAVSSTHAAFKRGDSPISAARAGLAAWREWQRVPLIHCRKHRSNTP